MQIKLQQAQSSRNISENMNKALQVSEPVLFLNYAQLGYIDCFKFCVYSTFLQRKS